MNLHRVPVERLVFADCNELVDVEDVRHYQTHYRIDGSKWRYRVEYDNETGAWSGVKYRFGKLTHKWVSPYIKLPAEFVYQLRVWLELEGHTKSKGHTVTGSVKNYTAQATMVGHGGGGGGGGAYASVTFPHPITVHSGDSVEVKVEIKA